MNPRSLPGCACGLIAPLLVLGATGARAQGALSLDLGGRAEVSADFERSTTETSGQSDREYDQDRLRETIGLEARGWAFRPGLLHFKLGGDFGLRHERIDQTDIDDERSRGRLFEYDGLIDLLADSPVSLSLFGDRFEDRFIQGFGADTEASGDSLGTTLRVSHPLLPSTFGFRRLRSTSETLGPAPTQRDETRHIFTFNGSRYSTENQFRVHYRDEDVDDNSFPAVGDYRIRDGGASIGRRWGDYLEHQFRTAARYFERSGNFDRDTLSSNTTYLWDVTEDFSTDLRYDFNRFDSDGDVTRTHLGQWNLRHELYDSLSSRAQLFGDRTSQPGGVRSQYGAGGSLDYRKQFLWGSRLLADGRFRRSVQDNDLDSSFVQVQGETLVLSFPPNFLANRLVDPDSIVVMDAAGNPFLEDFDYEVVVVGDRTSIEALPGGTINPPETVLVDYRFQTSPDAKILETGYGYGVGWEFDWLLVRYQHGATDERLLSGDDGRFLQDSRLDRYSVRLQHETPTFQVSAYGAFERERSSRLDRDEWSFGQSLFWRIARSVRLRLNLREQSTDLEDPERTSDSITGHGSLEWRIGRGRRAELFARLRRLDDSLSEDLLETIVGVRATFEVGRVEISPALRWTSRDRDPSKVTEWRGALRLTWRL